MYSHQHFVTIDNLTYEKLAKFWATKFKWGQTCITTTVWNRENNLLEVIERSLVAFIKKYIHNTSIIHHNKIFGKLTINKN
jgi:hypothetical protein